MLMKKLFVAVFLLMGIANFTSCSKDSSEEDDKQINTVENNQLQKKNEILQLINEVRTSGTKRGGVDYPPVGKLVWNEKLEKSALNHSKDMYDNNFFSHRSSDGKTLKERLRKVEYQYQNAGENIAKGYPNPQAVVEGWLNSPGHCANIMNGAFKEMGVAKVGAYWTQNFGSQRQKQ